MKQAQLHGAFLLLARIAAGQFLLQLRRGFLQRVQLLGDGFVLLPGGRRAVLVCAIDNLLKGAASQAVQNFNRMSGFEETEGLQ